MIKLEYKYDLQFLAEGKNINLDEVKKEIAKRVKGDCLLVVGDEGFCRVHYHTNDPVDVLKYIVEIGCVFSDAQVENMEEQVNHD